ncbi:LysR substrate-binding domain-containing protein [Hahella ganghwensis]|uniref:LysR substrate-binding domain-containing protein n=1 Tax=Hahella ganghwensis TaxID=286420 RepID=UPI0003740B57|nr:LysR substrate-binding domain-containing protein [Hahella ganghwensis]
MPRRLPPLNAVKAFEAAARHLSFTKAADELSVTQGAISKQIKTLESFLDTPLFERHAGGISLTTAGHQYLPVVAGVFDTLSHATRNLKYQVDAREPLLLNVIPSFASIWMLPRLKHFYERHPTVQVDIVTGDGQMNFANSSADAAIRCLHRDHTPPQAERILGERLMIVAAPNLLKESPVNKPEDILQHRLLPHSTRPGQWTRVLEGFDVDPELGNFGAGWEHFFMTLQAVKAGLGIGLVPDFLAQEQISSGDLVNVLGVTINSDYDYYWLCPGYKSGLHKVQVFHRWLKESLRPFAGYPSE